MMRLRMVVEWSKGSPFRYAWKEGHLALVAVDQPAPVNYGLIPGLINPADGEEVDAVFLGPPLPREARWRERWWAWCGFRMGTIS